MNNALILSLSAGLSTLIGGFVVFFIKKFNPSYLNISMGFAAGVMIFISLTDLLWQSINQIGYAFSIAGFFSGILIIYIIDILIPHSYESENVCFSESSDFGGWLNLKRCGLLVLVGIAIHNFPEGIAVFFSSLADIKLGIAVAIAIALHNIPEGAAVAMPIYFATKSRFKALWYSFLAGIAEPIGALAALLFLYRFINANILGFVLAAVAGMMIFISFDELLPRAYDQKDAHLTIFGIFAGMAMMAISLIFI